MFAIRIVEFDVLDFPGIVVRMSWSYIVNIIVWIVDSHPYTDFLLRNSVVHFNFICGTVLRDKLPS